jgi:hypothetical protein
MNAKSLRAVRFACLSVLLAAAPVHAGVYTDELSKCLVNSTTTTDRNALVRWIFAAGSVHPALKGYVTLTPAQLDEVNKTAGTLFMKLLTQTCEKQASAAINYEGKAAIEASFTVLGQVAGRELFSDPSVNAGMAGIQKYMDADKLQALVKPAPK